MGKGKNNNSKKSPKGNSMPESKPEDVEKLFGDMNIAFLNLMGEMQPQSTQEHENVLEIGIFFKSEIQHFNGASFIMLIREKILEVFRMFARRRTILKVHVNTSTEISSNIYKVMKNVEVETGAMKVFETKDHRTGMYAWIEQDDRDPNAIHTKFWSENVPWPSVGDLVNLCGLDLGIMCWNEATDTYRRHVLRTNGVPKLSLVEKADDWSLSGINGLEGVKVEMTPTRRLEWHRDESELPKCIVVSEDVARFMAQAPYQIRVFYPKYNSIGEVVGLRYLTAQTLDFEA